MHCPPLKVYKDSAKTASDPVFVSWACPLRCSRLAVHFISEQKDSSVLGAVLNSCRLLGPLFRDLITNGFSGAHIQKHLSPFLLLENRIIATFLTLQNHVRSWHLYKPSESFPQEFHHPLANSISTPLQLLSVLKIKLNRNISQALLCPSLLELLMVP